MKAFPNLQLTVSEMGQVRSINEVEHGMDLRDYFAAQAMQGFIALKINPQIVNATELANDAYMIADEMMEARK